MRKKGNLVGVILLFLLFLGGCVPHLHLDFMGKERIAEVLLRDSRAKEKILVLDLTGVIAINNKPNILDKSGDILSRIYFRLKVAAADPLVKGVVLKIDSPGGQVTAADIIYNEIMTFKADTGLPVLALMMDTAASGGYYAACACDYIMAHPTTVTGSIGVIAMLPGFKEMFDKIGVSMTVVKSGKMKDAGSPFREMSDEEKAYLQGMIDRFYKRFLEVVYRARREHLSMEEIEKLADGRVFDAQVALENKLIDQVGYFDQALEKILSMAKIRDAKVISYTYHPLKKTNIYAAAQGGESPFSLGKNILPELFPSLKTGFYYLWLPHMNR